jgi:hypothetical protein
VYPGAHALTQPDKPALIMASTGKTITDAGTLAHVSPRTHQSESWEPLTRLTRSS